MLFLEWSRWWIVFVLKTSFFSIYQSLKTWDEKTNQKYSEYHVDPDTIYEFEESERWLEKWAGSWNPDIDDWSECPLLHLGWHFSARRNWYLHDDDSKKTHSNTEELCRENAPQLDWPGWGWSRSGLSNYDSVVVLGDEYFGEIWLFKNYPNTLVAIQRIWHEVILGKVFVFLEQIFFWVGELFVFLFTGACCVVCCILLFQSVKPFLFYIVFHSPSWLLKSSIYKKFKSMVIFIDTRILERWVPGGRGFQIFYLFCLASWQSLSFDKKYLKIILLISPIFLVPLWPCYFLVNLHPLVASISFCPGGIIGWVLNYIASWFGALFVLLIICFVCLVGIVSLAAFSWKAFFWPNWLFRSFLIFLFCSILYPWFNLVFVVHSPEFTFSTYAFNNLILIQRKMCLLDYIHALESYCEVNHLPLSPVQEVWLLKIARFSFFMHHDPLEHCSTFKKVYDVLQENPEYFAPKCLDATDHLNLRLIRAKYAYEEYRDWLVQLIEEETLRVTKFMCERPKVFVPLLGATWTISLVYLFWF